MSAASAYTGCGVPGVILAYAASAVVLAVFHVLCLAHLAIVCSASKKYMKNAGDTYGRQR